MGLAFFDIETTGLDPHKHEILEVAVILEEAPAIEYGSIGEFKNYKDPSLIGWECKIRPDRIQDAEPAALRVNGYTEAKWEHSLPARQVLPMLVNLLEDNIIIGHNLASFDIQFLKSHAKRLGIDISRLPYRYVDTYTLAHEHLWHSGLKKLNLDNVCRFLGIESTKAHTAIGDVERIRKVYHRLCRASKWDSLMWYLRAPKHNLIASQSKS